MCFYVGRTIRSCLVIAVLLCVNQAVVAAAPVYEAGLDDVLLDAIRTSKDLAVQALQKEVIDTEIKATRGAFLPTVSASAVAGTQHIPVSPNSSQSGLQWNELQAAAGDLNFYQLNLSLNQNLFAGFSNFNVAKIAFLQKDLHEARRERIVRGIIEKACAVYLKHLFYLEQLGSSQQQLSLLRKKHSDVSARLHVGMGTALDAMRAEYEINVEQNAIAHIQGDIEKNNSALMRIVGESIGKVFVPSDSINVIFAGSGNLPPFATAYKEMIENNPEMKEIDLGLRLLELQYGVSTSLSAPKLDLLLEATNKADRSADIGGVNQTTYSGQVRMSVPLFSGLSSFTDREKYIAQRKQQVLNRQIRIEDLYSELELAYQDFQLADSRLKRDEASLKLADASVERADTLYMAGVVANTEVLEQYTKKRQALFQLAETRHSRVLAKIKAVLLIRGAAWR